jgi:protein-S-isoprenylcysteine O-methyltransferase Ste14
MRLFGQAPINKYLFHTGKFSLYLSWLAGLLQLSGINFRTFGLSPLFSNGALLLMAVGLTLFVISTINLGSSLRFGLPSDGTDLKHGGLYNFSRNPMYVGFYLLTLGTMLFSFNPAIIIISVYGIVILHFITLSEERFLQARFGQQYLDYRQRVRRYL